ncbi:OLC1v1008971C1 [Oldenlandia corymbosa var. corymbosa]|uniref:OLC1v1008971C1 n=1 Tax=Oldenlandia corymbosa var. corymbosa TaxID=529605 RepID=A0AAV1DMT5_OLDCO|nr:OLC1v1008971C1 [Oldenlandia corymbosa var. corymbosa]
MGCFVYTKTLGRGQCGFIYTCCNPSLRQCIVLPPSKDFGYGRFTCALGFGYDSVSQDYKVARVHHFPSSPYKFEVPKYVAIRHTTLRWYKGCISLLGVSMLKPDYQFELWSMMDDSPSTWVKRFAIPSDFGFQPVYSFTDVTVSGKILGLIDVKPLNHLPCSLAVFDLETGRVEVVVEGKAHPTYEYFLVDNYVESLVSVVANIVRRISCFGLTRRCSIVPRV